MSDQAVPTPPPDAQRPRFWEPPPRQVPFQPENTGWYLNPVKGDEDVALIALTVDTASGRTVTFWTHENAERLGRALLKASGKAPDGLVLATPDDLRKMGDGR